MEVDLTDHTLHETGPVQPKEHDVDVDVGDLAPLAFDRAAEGTRSKLTAAPPPVPGRARRSSTLPPPIPSRAARGSVTPKLVAPKATPEMMAAWQINPEGPLREVGDDTRAKIAAALPLRAKTASVPPPIPAAAKSKTMAAVEPPLPSASALPTTIELVRAPDVVKAEPPPPAVVAGVAVTGNAPSASATALPALPVVNQELIPSPRESRVAPMPTSQPGADVADLPQWPIVDKAGGPTLGQALAARASSQSLKLPAPRGRSTVPPPVASDVAAKPASALDGSDGWVFEDDYEERHVDGEVVPTTYFEREDLPEKKSKRYLIAIGAGAAALAAVVAIVMHGGSTETKKPVAPAAAAPSVPAPTQVAVAPVAPAPAPVAPSPGPVVAAPAPAVDTPPSAAETAVPTPAAPTQIATTPAPAPVAAEPAPKPVTTTPQLVTLPITSWPQGAVITLVDNGNATVLGPTPVNAALDPSHSYDVVFAIVGRPTTIKHVDLATMHELAVDLDPDPTTTPAAKPAEHHHHHHDVQVAAATAPRVSTAKAAPVSAPKATPAAAARPKQVAIATPAATGSGDGILMVSAKPPCEIIVDGKPTHLITPQRSISLSPGAHTITLVNAQIGIRKTVAVKVEAKQPTKLIKDFTKG